MGLFDKVISAGTNAILGTVSGVVDKFITTPDEKAKILADTEKELNRHLEAIELSFTHQMELQLQEQQSARNREIEIVKATGKHDFFMWFIGGSAIAIFGGVTVFLLTKPIPSGNEHIVINLIGILEGAVLTIYGYYYSSSLGSRIKDTVKK